MSKLNMVICKSGSVSTSTYQTFCTNSVLDILHFCLKLKEFLLKVHHSAVIVSRTEKNMNAFSKIKSASYYCYGEQVSEWTPYSPRTTTQTLPTTTTPKTTIFYSFSSTGSHKRVLCTKDLLAFLKDSFSREYGKRA